jgi:hypothetical protein
MKPSEIIKDQIKKELGGRFQSQDWYRNRLFEELDKVSGKYQDSDFNDTYGLELGKIYFFNYTAAFPDRYPYYDRFPFAKITSIGKQGLIYGINFHYLDPSIRGHIAEGSLKSDIPVPDKCLHSYYPQGMQFVYRVPDNDVRGAGQFITDLFVDKYNQRVKPNRVWSS